MTVICEACSQGANDEVKENAFECLGRVAELYYPKLPTYMQTILEQTLNAINTQSDAVARQAINVWVMVCDAEYDAENGDEPESCLKFIKGAAKFLVPVLLQTMAKQEDDQEPDAFNKSTEAAWCLAAIATVIENEVMEFVVPWVQQNIQQGDWRLKEAAVMAYGCILDGLNDQANMATHAPFIFDFCLGYIKDDANELVKNSAAWTIAKVCESEHAFVTVMQGMDARINRILEVMHTAEPSTSAELAKALRHIAENLLRMSEEPSKCRGDYPLAPVFQVVIECLYATADRSDADESNLRHECYETMNRVLESANPDKVHDTWKPTCNQVVAQFIIPTLLPRFGERLNAELGKSVVGADDQNARTDWVAYFCGAIQTCISTLNDKQMLTTPDANQQTVADKFMILFLQVFQFQNTTVAAEALLAVNQILNKLEGDFLRYMEAFAPVLVGCLGAVQDVPLCRTAITTVSDLANLLKDQVLPFSDSIVQALLGVFANPAVDADIQQVHDYIKPEVCSAIGDLAREIGKGMEKYLAVFVQALQAATQSTAKMRQELTEAGSHADEDKIEYLNAMIAGVLDGYTGILYGLQDAEKAGVPQALDAFLQPDALQNGALVMITEVAEAQRGELLLPGDEAINKAVGVVGDLAQNFRGRQQAGQLKASLSVESVIYLLTQGKQSDDDESKKLSQWAEHQVQTMA